MRWCSTQTRVNSRRAVSKSISTRPLQPLHHQRCALVVQAATAHVDRLDARLAAVLHGVRVAVDQQLVVLDQPAERPQRQAKCRQRTSCASRTSNISRPSTIDRRRMNGPVRVARDEPVGDGEVAHRLRQVRLLQRGQGAAILAVEHDARQRAIALGQRLAHGLAGGGPQPHAVWHVIRHGGAQPSPDGIMPSCSIRPMVAPLAGRSRPRASSTRQRQEDRGLGPQRKVEAAVQ